LSFLAPPSKLLAEAIQHRDSEKSIAMIATRIILASLAAFVLNALPVLAQREQGSRRCTSATSNCQMIPCDAVWGAVPEITCNAEVIINITSGSYYKSANKFAHIVQLARNKASCQLATMVSKHVILASLSAFVLNALPVLANEKLQGFHECTSATSDCIQIPCGATWGNDPKQTCNEKVNIEFSQDS
ncbi:hypothetical protein BUE80_DR006334, partial [Diplocarpon rosae]